MKKANEKKTIQKNKIKKEITSIGQYSFQKKSYYFKFRILCWHVNSADANFISLISREGDFAKKIQK